MSHQLAFWSRDAKSIYAHEDVYDRVARGEAVDDLPLIDIENVLDALSRRVTGWRPSSTDPYCWGRNDDPNHGWDISASDNGVIIDFYDVDVATKNEVIDAMYDLGFGCYDPGLGRFFDGS